jgi:hypothetical protein
MKFENQAGYSVLVEKKEESPIVGMQSSLIDVPWITHGYVSNSQAI